MKTALLATLFMWAMIIALSQILIGCSATFPIGNGKSVTKIKIVPVKSKSVYRPERWV